MFSIFAQGGKTETEPGLASYLVVVIFPSDCSWYSRAQAVVRGRALHDADTARHERGAPLLTLPRAAAGQPSPALASASATSLLPQQLAQSPVCQAAAGAGQWECPSDTFCHPGWTPGAPLPGAAWAVSGGSLKSCSQTRCLGWFFR